MSLLSDLINLNLSDTTEKVIAEYIWIGGSGMDLRSKARTLPGPVSDPSKLPKWNYDGSSTGQAPGEDSEVIIYPQAIFRDPFRRGNNILVICDTYTPAGEPIPTNKRHDAAKVFSHPDVVAEETWYGIEQEYTLLQKDIQWPLGWPVGGFPGPQGPYYCGVGADKAFGRDIVDAHYKACLYAGINISGINGEVMPGQWEFQVGPSVGISAGDEVWAARYILERITESSSSLFSLRNKPLSSPTITHFGNTKPSKSFSVRASSSRDSVVTLLDYGAGNVRSVRNAIRFLGFEIKDVQTPQDILNASRLVFPGVGAFAAAMEVLSKTGMDEALCSYIDKDRPFLGICLGLQLLFESSEENGPVKGLGLIPGTVGRFDSSNGFRVPHIGWNALQITEDSGILDDVGNHHVYFVHSYRAMPSDDNNEWISSTCDYGDKFIASIRRGNVHAVQFHPEKSGDVGLSILGRFLNPKSNMAKKPGEGKASKLAKRVIACLDVRTNDKGDLVVTKGDQYDVREHTKENEVRNLGKPVDLAGQYYKDGADEVSFLNITGFRDFPLGDLPMLQVLRYTSENVFVPLTVGGGIRDFTDSTGRYYSSLEVASEYFRSGADKISIGSDAVYAAEEYLKTGVKTGKTSLEQISRVYGNQAVVVSIDPRRVYVKDPNDVQLKTIRVSSPGSNGEEYAWYQCTVNGGREGRPIGAYELAKAVEELGAGEILLNCIDCDGQGKGFDVDLIKLISDAVSIPVIASSGAGAPEHFSEVFYKTNASAALAAGIFHRKEVPIQSVKEHLLKEGIEVRI